MPVVRTPFAALAILAIALVASAGYGQGLPIVPPPATSIEVMGYAEILELSDEQRRAVLTVHDQYRAEYRRFDEGDVTRLRDDVLGVVTQFMRSGFRIPERDALEAIIERHGRAMDRSKAIDRMLFDGMTPFLTERQLERLPRARAMRELEVLREIVTEMASGMNPGAGVDLAAITVELELDEEERARVDPILGAYAPAYAAALRRTYQALMGALRAGLDAVDQYGFRDMSQQEMFEYMQDEENQVSLQATFDEESKPVQSAVHDVSELNLRTYRHVLPLLGPEAAELFRDRYYEQAFREVHPGDRGWLERYREVLEIERLDASTRAALEAQRDETMRQVARLTDQIVVEIQSLRAYRTVGEMSGETRSPRQAKIDDLLERRTAITSAAEAALESMAGPDLLAATDAGHDGPDDHAAGSGEGGGTTTTVEISSNGGARTTVKRRDPPGAGSGASADPLFAPPPFSREEIDVLAEALLLDDEDRSVLLALYEDYVLRYQDAHAASTSSDTAVEGSDGSPPAPWSERQKALLTTLRTIDELFHDDLALVASGANAERLVAVARSVRRRATSQATTARLSPTFGNDEALSDLAGVVIEIGFGSEERGRLLIVLEGYVDEAVALTATQCENAIEFARVSRLSRRVAERGGEGGAAVTESLGRKMRDAMSGVQEANNRIVELNRAWVDRLASDLSPDAAWRLRSTYYRSAYPEIFRNFEVAEHSIERARALPDLAPAQERTIGRIATEHRDEQMRLVADMIALRRGRRSSFSGFEMPDRADIERELDLERLRFERRELEGRTRIRLALALSAEQRRLVPALDLTRLGVGDPIEAVGESSP